MAETRLSTLARSTVEDGVASAVLGGCCIEDAASLADASVLLAVSAQPLAAAAMVELDGLARRMVLAPPDATAADLAGFVAEAGIEAVVSDGARVDAVRLLRAALPPSSPSLRETGSEVAPSHRDTEWVLATSGTTGRPKLVVHSLAGLAGAIAPGASPAVWATFYDIRRYGGLQILLRAVLGGVPLVTGRAGETMEAHLRRLGRADVTHLSGTPSHWRRVLMSPARDVIAPAYIRLSGETADQPVLDALRAAFPQAEIAFAFASTEAGVAFAIGDGRAGFPAALLRQDGPTPGPVAMKIVDGTLRIRSARTASHYLGEGAPPLRDAEGYVDTGDLVEERDGRCSFAGRRGGIINVGGLKVNPEEVEAVLNAHPAVRMSRAEARRSPITGALVSASVVLRHPADAEALLAHCRTRLAAHKVPVGLRFVDALPLTPAGKLRR